MARARIQQSVEQAPPAEAPSHDRKAATAPWFFEATLKQEIQRRKQRRWRAAALVRMVTRVVLPGSMVALFVLCGVLVLL